MPDAVVVGAGPNGLAAALVLARRGIAVRVYEAAPTIGGGSRTAELTLPGFHHDVCSAVHPLAIGSPLLRRLPLAEHGLEWINPDVALAHPLLDGSAGVLERSVDRTADALGADAARYRRFVRPFLGRWDDLAGDVLRPITAGLPRHPLLLASFGARALPPAAVLARAFREPRTRALLAGLAAHAIAPLAAPVTGGVAALFAVAAHEVGWAFPRGGAQAIPDALAAELVQSGGEIVTGHPVSTLDELPQARAYLLDVSVPGLIRLAGRRLPPGYVRRLERVRPGPAVFKLDYALSGPVPWTAQVCRRAGTVHLGASMGEIGAALSGVARGRPPDRPFLIVAQPTVLDPTRAPAGRHVLWVYGHVPYGWDGDLTKPIESQIERFAPGWRDLILARTAAGPAELERRNANDVGGDIAFGRFAGRQALLRPVPARVPYATPDPAVFLCSGAAPPGVGVHGMCGAHAAETVLRRVFA